MRPLPDRRTFLAETAALAGAVTLGMGADAQERPMQPPVIDTHVHLWDLDRFRLPWLREDMPFNRSHLIAHYRQAIEGTPITKGVYMEVDVAPEQQQAEADYIIGLCRQPERPLVGAVVSGRPGTGGFAAYARQFRNHAYVKGIRQVLHTPATPAGTCLREPYLESCRLLGELGLSFDICIRKGELPDAARLADACRDTKFILDHHGNADVQERDRSQWQRDIETVARKQNVTCKISGIVNTARMGRWTTDDLAPIVNHCLDAFGPDRVMWASDWPVCTLGGTLRQWLEAVQQIVRNRPAADQRKLFYDNALRFYGLPA